MKLFFSSLLALFLLVPLSNAIAAEDLIEDFAFVDIEGKSHNTKDYRGKWVLVNYWGTYCPPCLEEIPDLIEFSDKHQDKAVILGLDAGGTDVEGLKKFKEDYFINYLIAPVQETTLDAFGVLIGIPTSYLITPEGEVVYKVIGIVDLQEIEQLMGIEVASVLDE